MVGPLRPVFKGQNGRDFDPFPSWFAAAFDSAVLWGGRGGFVMLKKGGWVMSKFMLTVALVLGSVSIGVRSASANLWYGPYGTQEQADAAGQSEIDRGAADSYGAGYLSDDPTGGGGGEGYYASVHYPDPSAPGAQPPEGDLTSAFDEEIGPYISKQAAMDAAESFKQRDDLYTDAWAVSPYGDGDWYVRIVKKGEPPPSDDGILGLPFPG